MGAKEGLPIDPGLLDLIDSNAWTFGPIATSLRILELTSRSGLPLSQSWEPILKGCKRMNPLGYWMKEINAGRLPVAQIGPDLMRRISSLLEQVFTLLGPSQNVLLVGHDYDTQQLLQSDYSGRSYRHLLLEGPAGIDSPGCGAHADTSSALIESPLQFSQLEEALDWADSVILSGFLVHSCNLLGPAQLRPFLMSARDQVDRIILMVPSERELCIEESGTVTYSEDFRPCLWNHSVTHLVGDHPRDPAHQQPMPQGGTSP